MDPIHRRRSPPRRGPADTGSRRTAALLGLLSLVVAAYVAMRFGLVDRPGATIPLPADSDLPGGIIGVGGGKSGGVELRFLPLAGSFLLSLFGLTLVAIALGMKVDQARWRLSPTPQPADPRPPHEGEPEPVPAQEAAQQPQPEAVDGRPVIVHSCPMCGAPVEASTRVSPRGDAICDHCDAWVSLPRDQDLEFDLPE